MVSACSGHGFKHSAAVGEAVCNMIIDAKQEVDLTPYSLSRFDV